MQVSLEHRPGSVVELSIEVPTEEVEHAIEEAFAHMSPNVRVAGFRPGKAPRAVLEREIGWPALREHALEHLLSDTIARAVVDNNLTAIDNPRVEVETFERLQPAKFKALVTVKPEVQLGDLEAVKAPLQEAPVGTDAVDAAIEEIRESLATLAPAENRPVREGDHLIVDLEVRKDGVAVDDAPTQNLELDVHSENLLPGLFDGLNGMSQGESKEIPVHLPDDYRRTELAGQDVSFALTVKEIKEHQLPEIDDELARLSGAGQTIGEMRERVEERLKAAAARDAVFAQQKAALDQLLESSKFEVPDVIVEDEIERDIRNLAISLGQQGIDFEKFIEFGGADIAQLREERRPAARDRAAQELVLDALANQQGIEPSQAHIDAEADRVLAGSDDAERLKSSERVRAYVGERMRLQWALLWLAAKARGEEWVEPEVGASDEEDGALAASEEVMAAEPEPSGEARVDAPELQPEPEPERADGMTEI